MSRSSVVWGPFSIVWGLAIGAVTALLYKYKDKSDSFYLPQELCLAEPMSICVVYLPK